jgi:hypothetical protein
MAIHVAIHPGKTETRVLALQQAHQALLKARLPLRPSHPRALPTLLEALSLWQGQKVHAALVADDRGPSSETSLYTDCFDVFEPTPLFHLAIVGHIGQRDRPKRIDGLGPFADLHRFLLEQAVR